MTQATKVKVASLITALFVGGLAAVGFATRESSRPIEAASEQEVVHKLKVRTVRVGSAATSSVSAIGAAASTVPVSAPARVGSSASPEVRSDEDEDDDDEGEWD